MDAFERHTDPHNETTACLIRIQQVMLSKGYIYIAGDRDAWPDTPVQMEKGDARILITPYHAGTTDQILDAWSQDENSTALLLVGQVDINAPEIDILLAHRKRKDLKLAYIDASRQQFRTQMNFWTFSTLGKEAILSGNIKTFFNASKYKSSARIDCAAQLAEHMQEQADIERFTRTATRLSRFKQASLSIGMIILFCSIFAIMTIIYGLRMLYNPPVEALLDWGALHGPLVKTGQWWRIFSVALLHGGCVHLLVNCLFLFIFGSLLEIYQGSWRTFLYFVAGVWGGSIASLWWHPEIVGVGASGGLFGLIGAVIALIIRHRREFPPRLWRAWRKMLLTILLYNSLYILRAQIDSAAHIGGLIGGFAAAFVLARSPVKIVWPRFWVWPMLISVLLIGLMLSNHVIANIPDNIPSATDNHDRQNAPNGLSAERKLFDDKELKRTFAILTQMDHEMRLRGELLKVFRDHQNQTRPFGDIRRDILHKLGPEFVKKLETWKQQVFSRFARQAVRAAVILNATRMEHCRLIIGVSDGSVSYTKLLHAEMILEVHENDYVRELNFARNLLKKFEEQ